MSSCFSMYGTVPSTVHVFLSNKAYTMDYISKIKFLVSDVGPNMVLVMSDTKSVTSDTEIAGTYTSVEHVFLKQSKV